MFCLCAPNLLARINAKVVLPNPGGDKNIIGLVRFTLCNALTTALLPRKVSKELGR